MTVLVASGFDFRYHFYQRGLVVLLGAYRLNHSLDRLNLRVARDSRTPQWLDCAAFLRFLRKLFSELHLFSLAYLCFVLFFSNTNFIDEINPWGFGVLGFWWIVFNGIP